MSHLCGFEVRRCAGCDNTVARDLDACPKCDSQDIGPGTCRKVVKADGHLCFQHEPGSRAPQVQRKELERKLESDLERLLSKYDTGPVENPLEALLERAGKEMAWEALTGDRVAALELEWRYTGRTGEQLRAEIPVHERARDRLNKVLADISRLRIEERLADHKARMDERDRTALLAVVLALVQWITALVSRGELPTEAQVRERLVLEIRERTEP